MKRVPCFINAFNQLTLLRSMVEHLVRIEALEVIVVDNASTLPQLLRYYESAPCRVIRLEANLGHRAGWLSGVVDQFAADYYLYTDPDLDVSGVPDDFLEVLIRGHERHEVDCVGLSLEIADIPANSHGQAIREWENRFWRQPTDDGYFRAAVDTTMGLYHRSRKASGHERGLRTDRPYTARHVPWYYTQENPPPEDYGYYLATCNQSCSYAPRIRAACFIEPAALLGSAP